MVELESEEVESMALDKSSCDLIERGKAGNRLVIEKDER